MTRRRSLARQAAMKILFQVSLVETDLDEILEYHRNDLHLDEDGARFASELVKGATTHGVEIDALLRPQLENWDLDRIGNVEKAILRLAVYELIHCASIPSRVTINEAVELSKEFASEGAGKFVNGVLDRLARTQVPAKMS